MRVQSLLVGAVLAAGSSALAQVDVDVEQAPPAAVSVDAQPPPAQPAVDLGEMPASVQGGDVADVGVFNAALETHGEWIDVPGVGRVWRPYSSEVGADFAPYQTAGEWTYSDAGWTYVSDWSWGWAPFHYGNWWNQPGYGWAWLPGTRWAPAWVDWRYGGAYVGWAPRPPVGFAFGVNMAWGTPWCFLETRYMVERHWGAYAVPGERVHAVYGMTTSVPVRQGFGYSGGPPVSHVVASVGHPITAVPVTSLGHATPPATVTMVHPLVASSPSVAATSHGPQAQPQPGHTYQQQPAQAAHTSQPQPQVARPFQAAPQIAHPYQAQLARPYQPQLARPYQPQLARPPVARTYPAGAQPLRAYPVHPQAAQHYQPAQHYQARPAPMSQSHSYQQPTPTYRQPAPSAPAPARSSGVRRR